MEKKLRLPIPGYVGLSMATLFAQHNHVVAVDVYKKKSPVADA